MDNRFLTSKLAIQSSVENLVGKSSDLDEPESDPRNPKVAPGLVKWHDNFDAACAAARKSGRPVLLFQMLGKLNEIFC